MAATIPSAEEVAQDHAARRATQDAKWTQVKYEKQGRVALVTMNRPRQFNTIGRAMSFQLDEAFTEACNDDEVRCILLAGAGENFSSGHDLGTKEQHEGLPLWRQADLAKLKMKGAGMYDDRFTFDVGLCLRWRDLPKPLIAKVRGLCIYHAAAVMSCADVVFAAEDARIMPSYTQYYAAPYDIGTRKAKELLFQGTEFLSGKLCEELGFVNRAVPNADLDKAVDEYVAKVVKQPAFTLRMYKQAVNQKDDQAGFHNFVRGSLSHWTLLMDAAPPPKNKPKPGDKPRMIPKDASSSASSKSKL